ncbi:MAG: septation inhibitor protein [Lactobacillus sp.]|jgi:septum site-determining protein MinC|nr:septation inhibitor protein [Lactobacillus sp.]
MDSVILKGRKNGYEITLNASANFDDNMVDLNRLLEKLSEAEQESDSDLGFYLKTGSRLLNDAQTQRIYDLFDKYKGFSITDLQADVADLAAIAAAEKVNHIHVEMATIRSGQEVSYESDVLFLGNLHPNGVLKSRGNIFVMGDCSGILCAGFPDNEDAVIVGDISDVPQIRISDTVEIINKKNQQFSKSTVALINDLHVLDFDTLDNLSSLRPKLYRKMEDNL